jgi:hypothetical protein
MPALVAGIHVLNLPKDVDGRNKSGHDELLSKSELIRLRRVAAKE